MKKVQNEQKEKIQQFKLTTDVDFTFHTWFKVTLYYKVVSYSRVFYLAWNKGTCQSKSTDEAIIHHKTRKTKKRRKQNETKHILIKNHIQDFYK